MAAVATPAEGQAAASTAPAPSDLPPSRVIGLRAEDVRRIEYHDRSDANSADAVVEGDQRYVPLPDVGPVVVEGPGVTEVARAFLKAFDSAAYRRRPYSVYHAGWGLVSVRLFLKDTKGQEKRPERQEPLIFYVWPEEPPERGTGLQEAFAALSRWQAGEVARRMRPRLEGRPGAPPVSRVWLQVSWLGRMGQNPSNGYAPRVEIASGTAAVRPYLEALCHLDERAFAYTKPGQTAFVWLVAPDGTREIVRLRVALSDPIEFTNGRERRYPGVSRAMEHPPLPRPLWEAVYNGVYGDKEP
jgi:hypothetical protein